MIDWRLDFHDTVEFPTLIRNQRCIYVYKFLQPNQHLQNCEAEYLLTQILCGSSHNQVFLSNNAALSLRQSNVVWQAFTYVGSKLPLLPICLGGYRLCVGQSSNR
eukprot:TCONS_00068092-protein